MLKYHPRPILVHHDMRMDALKAEQRELYLALSKEQERKMDDEMDHLKEHSKALPKG